MYAKNVIKRARWMEDGTLALDMNKAYLHTKGKKMYRLFAPTPQRYNQTNVPHVLSATSFSYLNSP